jgi:GT2 family glycosyltransferase
LKLLAIIVNYRTPELTLRAAEGLLRELAGLPDARVAIVDNDSGDDSLGRLRDGLAEPIAAGRLEVIASPENGGFAFGVNQAVRPALASDDPPEFVYLLNSDAYPAPGAVIALLRFLDQHPEIGIAGSYIHGPDGETHHTAFRFPSVASQFEQTIGVGFVTKLLDRWVVSKPVPSEATRVDWLAGASMLIRRRVFDATGLLDENYFMYFEETDFCLNAARAGWPTWYFPASRVEHVGAASSGWKDFSQPRPPYWFQGRRYFFLKNHGRSGLWAANLAWIAGYALGEARRLLQRRPRRQPPRMFRDFLRHNLTLRRVGRSAPAATPPAAARAGRKPGSAAPRA